MTNYCINCSIALGIRSAINVSSLDIFGTSYQRKKFREHTIQPTNRYISKFTDVSTSTYQRNINLTISSGYLEFYTINSFNLILPTPQFIGNTFQKQQFILSNNNAIKLVYPNDSSKLHAFPIPFSGTMCANCGGPLR